MPQINNLQLKIPVEDCFIIQAVLEFTGSKINKQDALELKRIEKDIERQMLNKKKEVLRDLLK